MRNLRELKVRRYAACIIYLNEYLDALPEAKASEKLVRWNLIKNILSSMPNGSLSTQKYVTFIGLKKYQPKFPNQLIYVSLTLPKSFILNN